MKLPLHIAKSLLALTEPERKMPASALKHPVINKLIEDGVLLKQQLSKSKAYIYVQDKDVLAAYLHNHFGINDLQAYISGLENTDLKRSESVVISGNSKLKAIRTFTGFLVNSYDPVSAILNGKAMLIQPPIGSFIYISDYSHFTIDADTVVVGIENSENFAKVHQQQYLFEGNKVLFVSRYPQNKDLIKWLRQIPNRYLHFGDLDLAGISIYLYEFKAFLGDRASLLLPANAEELVEKFGSRELFNRQYQSNKSYIDPNHEEAVQQLYLMILRHKKVLEQEIFIK